MRQLSPARLYDYWKKSGGPLLCLDVGRRNVGVAISAISKHGNPTMKPIHDTKFLPYDVLYRQKKDHSHEFAGKLHALSSKYSVTAIVAGCPLDRFDGGPRCPTSRARGSIYPFFVDLKNSGKFSGMPYTLWDELYSTKAVEFLAEHEKISFTDTMMKKIEDTFAALQIGEEFLDDMNKADLPSDHRKPVCLSEFEFVASMQHLFSVDKMTKEELYHRFFMNYKYDDEEQIEEQLYRLEKFVPGLIRKEVDHLYSIDEEKIVKLRTLMKDQSKSE